MPEINLQVKLIDDKDKRTMNLLIVLRSPGKRATIEAKPINQVFRPFVGRLPLRRSDLEDR